MISSHSLTIYKIHLSDFHIFQSLGHQDVTTVRDLGVLLSGRIIGKKIYRTLLHKHDS